MLFPAQACLFRKKRLIPGVIKTIAHPEVAL